MNVFITGTDTDCGKTWVSAALLRAVAAQGVSTLGMKPIASGATCLDGTWRNADVEQLQAASSVRIDRVHVNPYLFEMPASPNIAAAEAGASIDLERIVAAYQVCAQSADFVVVEGVGGWFVPLNATVTVADLAARLGLPVILVVGVRLGCINHALLSAAAIAASGVSCHGWIANQADPTVLAPAAMVDTLRTRLPWPLLAELTPGADSGLNALARELAPATGPASR